MIVKKGFVILLLALALVVLISPGIVGRLAERSVDQNLEWAATESQEIVVTSQGFDRGWFSSEGQHRIELRDGEIREAVAWMVGPDSDVPVLVIDTHIDHGLVPVSSMSREHGSLAPGLGSAVSTMRVELGNGSSVDLPGTIYSKVGLTGDLQSNFLLEPGSFTENGESVHWGNVDMLITTSPSADVIRMSGEMDALRLVSASNEIGIGPIEVSGRHQATRYGIGVGDLTLTLDAVSMPSTWGTDSFGPITLQSESSLDGDEISGVTTMRFQDLPMGDIGRGNIAVDMSVTGVDAQALANVSRAIDEISVSAGDDELMAIIENDLMRLLANGFKVRIRQLDIELQQGSLETRLDATLKPTDLDDFVWTSALLAFDATFDLSVPADIMDAIIALDPDARAAIAMGFLKLNGNAYEMQAEFKKGVLTVNGAPLPLPWLGGNLP